MSGGVPFELLGFFALCAAIAVVCALLAGGITAVVLRGRAGPRDVVWLPSLAGALRPEPSPLLAYLIAVTDLVMAARAGFLRLADVRSGRRVAAWLDEVAGHCAAVKLRGRALHEHLEPYLDLAGVLGPAADALLAAWSDEHQMRGADGEWSSYHAALARVATRGQGESRHVWVLDREAALGAVDTMISACDLAPLRPVLGSEYHVDLDALDPDDLGRLDRVWPDDSQPIQQVWQSGTLLPNALDELQDQCAEFLARLRSFRVELEEAPGRYEVASADLHAEEPGLLVQARQARDWVNDPRLWRAHDLQRTMAAGGRAIEQLAIVVAAHGASDRRVMASALRVHSAVYPNARPPLVVGLSRLEKVGVVVLAMVVAFVVTLPMAVTLVVALR